MDTLSEILGTVRISGALFFNGEFSAPWCLDSHPSPTLIPHLCPGAEHLIIYHLLTEGNAFVRLQDGSREELSAGDIVVFPHGDGHFLGNGSPEKPVDALHVLSTRMGANLSLVRWGGGGEITKLVCGYLSCDAHLNEVLLTGLPKLMKVRVGGGPAGEWLENSIRFSVGAANDGAAGSGIVLAKLSEAIFTETLRCYVNTMPPEQRGWLSGTRDAVIGRALALLHGDPSHPWTIAELAKRAGLSRTRLTERFRHYLGETPMAYLTRWRMKLGADLLASSDDGVAVVAATVGYGSEAAFNRAFARQFRCPPAQYRRQRRARTQRSSP